MVKIPPANAGDVGNSSSVSGSGRSPEEEKTTHSSILAWKTPWTKDPGGYSPWAHKELEVTENAHTHNINYYFCGYGCNFIMHSNYSIDSYSTLSTQTSIFLFFFFFFVLKAMISPSCIDTVLQKTGRLP